MLCLDEAFSALDVLTAETLRHEIIALWQKQVANLKSIFMVTHNIEEAVEMATHICILFPIPDEWASYWKTNCHIRAMPSRRNFNVW